MQPIVLRDQDIDDLNRAAVNRSAAIARLGGGALAVIGAGGVLSWLWVFARSQAQADEFNFNLGSGGSESPDLADRLDLASSSIGLLLSASLLIGLGLLLRAASDYFQARTGGSITGFVAGDVLGDEPGDDPAQ